jgi:hypothetical protein
MFAAQIIEGAGWTRRIAVLARPFMQWGHLNGRMGAAFTTAFFSGIASLSMLMSFYRDGRITRRETFCTVLLNTFPSFFLHLPTTFFILLPLIGSASIVYLLVMFGAAFFRLIIVLALTRNSLPAAELDKPEIESEKINWGGLLRETAKKFGSRLRRILLIVVPVYLVVILISDMGFFLWLKGMLVRTMDWTFIPVEAASVVILSLMAETTSGFAAAGAMLESGSLNVFQTVLALLIGNVLASPIRALRHQLPYYMGIFGPRFGLSLMLASQAFRVGSLVVTGMILIAWVTWC